MSHSGPERGDFNDGGAAAEDPAVVRFDRAQAVKFAIIVALFFAGAVALVRVFAAERIPELTETDYAAAEKLWKERGPASYDMDVVLRGAQPGSVHVEVRDGKATALTRDGKSPAEHTWEYWTVPGMFTQLEDEFALAQDPTHKGQGTPDSAVWLRCQFNSQYGYPQQYHRTMTGGGPEVYWHVTKFELK